MAKTFKFELKQSVAISCSSEIGEVVARSESSVAEDQYLLRYQAKDGRAVEQWWSESALVDPGADQA